MSDFERIQEMSNSAKLAERSQQKPLAGDLYENLNSPIIQIIGDSTSNEHLEWAYLLAQKIAAKFPEHNIKYALYDQPNGRYGVWENIQTVGEERHLAVGSTPTGVFHYIPDSEVVKTSPDLDFGLKVALDDWQQADNPFLFTKMDEAGHYCLGLRLMSNKIYMVWTTAGSTLIQKDTGIDTTAFVDGSAKWIRATLDVDNGASGNTVTGYTSTDGVTWTPKTPVVTAGVTSVFVDTAVTYKLGGRSAGSAKAPGKYYEAFFRDGIGGVNILPQPIEAFRPTDDVTVASVFGGTPTVYIYNASISGSGMAEWNNEAYVKSAIPITQGANLFINLGHNDYRLRGSAYVTALDSFWDFVKVRAVAANAFLVTQNPVKAPFDHAIDRSIMRRMLMSWAASKGMSVIDTYQTVERDSRGLDVLLKEDGLHPSDIGSALMADKIWSDLSL